MEQQASDLGMNRTGMSLSPRESKGMMENAGEGSVPGADSLAMADVRRQVMRESSGVGKVPPPATPKGMFTTTREMLKGNKPSVFIDHLGERLAFERTGVRLYDAILTKFADSDTWQGGPTRVELETIRDEELNHLHGLKDAIIRLGADPTVMTPAADVAGVASEGVLKVITDPRTNLAQSLQALLIAERADLDGWAMLINLAEGSGQDELARNFRQWHEHEQRHNALVNGWVSTAVDAELRRDLSH